MLPASAVSSPAMILSKVVLPHPDGPSKAISSPELMSSDTSRNAWKSPNFLLTLRISMLIDFLSFSLPLWGRVGVGARRAALTLALSQREREQNYAPPRGTGDTGGRSGGISAASFISRSCRHSTTDLMTSVTRANSASNEATANAATDWYSL
jgi:hypothetical protein